MPRTFALIAVLLVALLCSPWTCSWRDFRPVCGTTRSPASYCRDRVGDDHIVTNSIEDEILKDALVEKSLHLIDQGQTVDTQMLIKQLSAGPCILELFDHEPTQLDSIDLFQTGRDAVVVVGGLYQCDNCSRWHTSIASGFVIHPSGAIVTNYHVVDSPDKQAFVVMTADQRVYPVRQILAASREDDLAILQIPAENLHALPLATRAADAPVGADIRVISHPDGRFYCYTDGIVSRHMKMRSRGRVIDALAITADYARGSSGAPVLNRQGQVVAIVSSTESIYYTQDGARQRDLQMVLKTCIPSTNLLRLIVSRPPHVTGNEAASGPIAQADVP